MPAQNGRDLLIRVDMLGDGTFQTIAGLRATRISFNAETVRLPLPPLHIPTALTGPPSR